jgi:ApbE superfamily uncharacterized protein (UPF0280 family)
MAHKERSYRSWTKAGDLVFFEVIEGQTDLAIYASRDLGPQARAAVMTCRGEIEAYIARDRRFFTSLEPVTVDERAGAVIRSMAEASRKALVGPMAAVAGAIAEYVGRQLLAYSDEVIVENGGDIFLRTAKKRAVGIYAGDSSPFTGKLAIEIRASAAGLGVCTSSGTVSHSLSFGKADAVVIVSPDTALADAVATSAGNILKSAADIQKGIDFARSVDGVTGVVAIVGDKMGSWGDISLI